jgi:hypothetical protein
MLQMHVPSLRRLGPTRKAVRDELHGRHYADQHITAVEAVVAELLGAAYESQAQSPIVITVERFALLISVRVRCSGPVDIRDEPFHLRERVLHEFALGFGSRRNPDGTIDLWAELPRARPGNP